VKLLFDENLSPRLATALADLFPDSQHVRDAGLRGATDHAVWDYAKEYGFAIVSKDNDFRQLAFVKGAPPKVVWVAVGNAGTDRILRLLRSSLPALQAFDGEIEETLLILYLPDAGTPGAV
jgi:predicted nuclease of predicted toxin-antitoxin system